MTRTCKCGYDLTNEPDWKTECKKCFAIRKAAEDGPQTDVEVNDKGNLDNKITMLALLKNANVPYDKMQDTGEWAEAMWQQAEALKKAGQLRGCL